jgi:PleD family two-component response regulator
MGPAGFWEWGFYRSTVRKCIKERFLLSDKTLKNIGREEMDTHRKEKILVIDDEEIVVKVLRALLSKEGFDIESAPDGLAPILFT